MENEPKAEGETEKEESQNPQVDEHKESNFKKPTLLVGKIGKLPKKVAAAPAKPSKQDLDDNHQKDTLVEEQEPAKGHMPETSVPDENATPKNPESPISLPYREPEWSGLPESSGNPYTLEVLKNGIIVETINLMKKPFWVIGRQASCDIPMHHLTISRFHAVLQYRSVCSESDPPGFYIYDLGSTHGTFLNGKNNKLKPKVYAPVRVGHMLRLGCSTRTFILTGPEDDQEDESELSVTELKQLRDQKIKEHDEKMRLAEIEMEEKRKKEEERGVDWGMGDDANDMEDLSENPYASTNNEELYISDPKKALRGFFEREGLDLEYDCTEQGMGQFLCKVPLPLDDENGRPLVAEVLHRGKKKEAVVQCALEACKILDRFGCLRPAAHESKKRKTKDWSENDYYDSDDDTFLDRTGTIEKKREKRMQAKEPEKVETYDSLVQKEKQLSTQIAETEKRLALAQAKLKEEDDKAARDVDSLDAYMTELANDKPDKITISKLKIDLAALKKEHAHVLRLANIAKPAELPALNPSPKPVKKPFPFIGKKKIFKYPLKPTSEEIPYERLVEDAPECEEEEEEADEAQPKKDETVRN